MSEIDHEAAKALAEAVVRADDRCILERRNRMHFGNLSRAYLDSQQQLAAVPDVVAALRECERELLQMRMADASRWILDCKDRLRHAESGYTIMKARSALAAVDATDTTR